MKIKLPKRCHEGDLPRRVEAKRGCITSRRGMRSIWQAVGQEVYLTCGFCGEINRVTDTIRDDDGHTNINFRGRLCGNCVTCVQCGGHNMVEFLGWTAESFRICPWCNKPFYGTPKELGLKTYYFLCPGCRKDPAAVKQAEAAKETP